MRTPGGVAVALAVAALLDYYGVECAGKKVTVVGRGAVTGAPAAALLADRGADVSVCHSRTENPAELCREADILVCTAGRAGLIGRRRYGAGGGQAERTSTAIPPRRLKRPVTTSRAGSSAATRSSRCRSCPPY